MALHVWLSRPRVPVACSARADERENSGKMTTSPRSNTCFCVVSDTAEILATSSKFLEEFSADREPLSGKDFRTLFNILEFDGLNSALQSGSSWQGVAAFDHCCVKLTLQPVRPSNNRFLVSVDEIELGELEVERISCSPTKRDSGSRKLSGVSSPVLGGALYLQLEEEVAKMRVAWAMTDTASLLACAQRVLSIATSNSFFVLKGMCQDAIEACSAGFLPSEAQLTNFSEEVQRIYALGLTSSTVEFIPVDDAEMCASLTVAST